MSLKEMKLKNEKTLSGIPGISKRQMKGHISFLFYNYMTNISSTFEQIIPLTYTNVSKLEKKKKCPALTIQLSP